MTTTYQNPFRHWIVDVDGGAWTLGDIYAGLDGPYPQKDWPHWIPYNSPFEKKKTCEDLNVIPKPLAECIQYLQSQEMIQWLERLTGIEGLQADPSNRGGGLHQSGRGDFLDVHLDYKIHPRLHLERRLNLILFCPNRPKRFDCGLCEKPSWDESWGGALELWDSDGRECRTKIYPKYGRLVIFECSDISYHGVPEPIACPPDITRNTIAVYYLSPPQGRRRALFVPKRATTVATPLSQI